MNLFDLWIKNPLLIHSILPNKNTFLSMVIHYISYVSIQNINIVSTSKSKEMSNRKERFVDSYKRSNVVDTPANSSIWNISNSLNNLIPKSF